MMPKLLLLYSIYETYRRIQMTETPKSLRKIFVPAGQQIAAAEMT